MFPKKDTHSFYSARAGPLPDLGVVNPGSSDNPDLPLPTFSTLPWLSWTQLGSPLGHIPPIPTRQLCLPVLHTLQAWQISSLLSRL